MTLVCPVLAAEESSDEPAVIQPSVGIRFDYDSNIFDTSMREIESWIGIVTPKVLFSQNRYSLLYEGAYGRFFNGSADNYADHALTGSAGFQLGTRGHFDFSAATAKGHQDRGSGQTGGFDPASAEFPNEPDEFDSNTWQGEFRYGAEGARGRLRLGLGGSGLDHTNNRARTQFFDRQSQFGSASIALRSNRRTAVVFEVQFADTEYDRIEPGEAGRDSEDWRYLLGVTWQATAKTSGSVRLGAQRRSFDDPNRPKTSNASWEVEVRWSPREYHHFDFVTARTNEETVGEGAFIDLSAHKISWTFQGNRDWESVLRWTFRGEDFVGSMRKQDLTEWYLGLRYLQGRRVTWEAGYARRSRDSSFSELNYSGNLFSVGANIGI